MDLDKLSPVRLPQEMLDAYTIDPQLEGEWNLRKRKLPDAMTRVYDFTVTKLHRADSDLWKRGVQRCENAPHHCPLC